MVSTTSISTTNSFFKSTGQPWEHEWHLHTLTYSRENWNNLQSKTPLSNLTFGGGLLMTSSWCGQKEKTIFKLSYIYINSIHPTIKFKHEFSNSSHQSLPFLDVQVHLDNSLIETDLHTEPTDKHQYLLKTSCHPVHTKRTIPFSLALRLRRICSTDDFFNKLCDKLINFLELRGYSRHFFKKEINQARFIPR